MKIKKYRGEMAGWNYGDRKGVRTVFHHVQENSVSYRKMFCRRVVYNEKIWNQRIFHMASKLLKKFKKPL